MKVATIKQTHLSVLTIFLSSILGLTFSHTAGAEEIDLPLERIVATESVTKLEVISTVKTLFTSARVLSVKKKSTYTNPDCHHVKALDNKGELQSIRLGCYVEKLAHKDNK